MTRSLLAACSIVALSAVMYGCVHSGGDDAPATDTSGTPDPMPEPVVPVPVDVTMDVDVSDDDVQERLLAKLRDSDSSDTLTIPAGGMATRGASATQPGVVFTCMSDYPCTVTVTNSLGTILASVTTQMLPDADDPVITAGLPDPVDAFVRQNSGSTGTIRSLVVFETARAADAEGNPGNPAATELIGMGIGGPGVLNADEAGLRSIFDPNGGDFVDDAGARAGADTAAADPGAPPALMGGSTITGADDGFDASMSDIAPAPDGWGMKTLFRDWGDTAGSGDGGYETGAIVVKNIEEGGTEHPFDRKLADRYATAAAQNMFKLSVLADGEAPTPPALADALATSVDIDSAEGDAMATTTQWAAMVFDSDSLVGAQSQDPNVNAKETFAGSYFGASGQFQCVVLLADNCGLARNADGTVGVIDTEADTMGIQGGGNWTFTPDPGATILVPDQDWMAYGAWLTTPNAGGTHRLGVFFNGLDVYEPAEFAFTVDNAAGLRGSATYSGGATGIYVDGDFRSGLFTARAMLTANFDVNSNGTTDAANDVDEYTISGRIDNFRGTNGMFLGGDTAEDPNDPIAGGENDWVVVLGMDALDATVVADATAGNVMGSTSGSADGVPWTGTWDGQLFGPSTDADGPIAPSGVAGQFRAATADVDPAVTTDALPVTAVVGAFGATKDD